MWSWLVFKMGDPNMDGGSREGASEKGDSGGWTVNGRARAWEGGTYGE